ncbi:MAG: POTRA domain-containing protein, partial [Pseudomonadota bacterium]
MRRKTGGRMAQQGASLLRSLKPFHTALVWLMLSGVWLSFTPPAAAQDFRFDTVVINGNERIGDAAILRRMGISRGEVITGGRLNDGVQNLQNSGLFETVEVEPRGGTLVVTVVELPTLNRIRFEGNRRIDDETLSAVVQLQERRVFNPTLAEEDAAAIAQAYAH